MGKHGGSLHVNRHQSHLKWTRHQPPVLTVQAGDTVTFDCIEASNGQITRTSTDHDCTKMKFELLDPVFGPVYIEGAEPGDALEVEIVDLQHDDWGWCVVMPGFGLLANDFDTPYLKHFDLPASQTQDVVTTNGDCDQHGQRKTEQLMNFNKDIRIPLRPFMGTIGVAPGDDGEYPTIPPLETGGNIDCRHVSQGTKLLLPVKTPGALFSCGDGHAAQGDGEVCGAAIETGMRVTLRFQVLKKHDWVRTPHYRSPPESKTLRRALPDCGSYSTIGIDTDMLEATRKAVRQMIEHLGKTRGMSREDAYMLCSIAAEMRLGEVVDMPNFAMVATIPNNLFVADVERHRQENADADTNAT